jgi:GTP-binding protein Era
MNTGADDADPVGAEDLNEGEAGPRRCGLVAIIGKPNVGKSTLLNALVGQKISITSRKAQTTRHRITGIRTVGATQFVFVDTPGFQTRHANALNRSLNKTVLGAVGDVDLVLFVVEAGQFNQADERVLKLLGEGVPVLLIAPRSRPGCRTCSSACRRPRSCRCRPRTRKTSSVCLPSAPSTCPSRTGGTTRTS